MKNLKNALLLKQLYQLKQLGFKYTSLSYYKEEKSNLLLPNTLEKLQMQAKDCYLCELSKSRTNVVFGEGNPNATLMFVGEGPGATEDSTGKPFVGRSGELLNKIIENVLHLKREEVYLSNIVKCRPPNNRTPTPTESHTCQHYLFKQIDLIRPKIIIALGTTAYQYLSGNETKMKEVRGVLDQKNDYLLMATYHPSYLLRNPSAKKEVYEDMLKIKSLL